PRFADRGGGPPDSAATGRRRRRRRARHARGTPCRMGGPGDLPPRRRDRGHLGPAGRPGSAADQRGPGMNLAASWRAAIRVARREARRAKGRSVLVIAMIALPVLFLSFAAVTYDMFTLTGAEKADRMMGA